MRKRSEGDVYLTLRKNEIAYLSCILCGMSKAGKIVPRAFKTPPQKWMAIEIRENRGGRHIGGFFLKDGFTLAEALKSEEPEVRELAELQREKLLTVVRAYLREGVLDINDFEEGS